MRYCHGLYPMLLAAVASVGIGTEARPQSVLPAVSLEVTVDSGRGGQFVNALQSIAEKRGFAIRVGHPNPSPEYVLVQMFRDDIEIVAVNSRSPDKFGIGLYKVHDDDIEASKVEVLDELRAALRGIPGGTLTVK